VIAVSHVKVAVLHVKNIPVRIGYAVSHVKNSCLNFTCGIASSDVKINPVKKMFLQFHM
jgi:hypothetical protein